MAERIGKNKMQGKRKLEVNSTAGGASGDKQKGASMLKELVVKTITKKKRRVRPPRARLQPPPPLQPSPRTAGGIFSGPSTNVTDNDNGNPKMSTAICYKFSENIANVGEAIHAGICSYFQKGHLTDIVLHCEATKFPTHRLLLSLRSPYFDNLFKTHEILMKSGAPIIVAGMTPAILTLILEFIYNGTCYVEAHLVTEFWRAGIMLQVRGIFDNKDAINAIKQSVLESLTVATRGSCPEDQPVNDEPIDLSFKGNNLNLESTDSPVRYTAIPSTSADASASTSTGLEPLPLQHFMQIDGEKAGEDAGVTESEEFDVNQESPDPDQNTANSNLIMSQEEIADFDKFPSMIDLVHHAGKILSKATRKDGDSANKAPSRKPNGGFVKSKSKAVRAASAGDVVAENEKEGERKENLQKAIEVAVQTQSIKLAVDMFGVPKSTLSSNLRKKGLTPLRPLTKQPVGTIKEAESNENEDVQAGVSCVSISNDTDIDTVSETIANVASGSFEKDPDHDSVLEVQSILNDVHNSELINGISMNAGSIGSETCTSPSEAETPVAKKKGRKPRQARKKPVITRRRNPPRSKVNSEVTKRKMVNVNAALVELQGANGTSPLQMEVDADSSWKETSDATTTTINTTVEPNSSTTDFDTSSVQEGEFVTPTPKPITSKPLRSTSFCSATPPTPAEDDEELIRRQVFEHIENFGCIPPTNLQIEDKEFQMAALRLQQDKPKSQPATPPNTMKTPGENGGNELVKENLKPSPSTPKTPTVYPNSPLV